MPSKRIQLTITAPCQQSWQAMEADKAGRFCANCQKTVVDFTGLTDIQIASTLANRKGLTCGRFRQSQLNRPLHVAESATRPPNRLFSLLAAGVLGYQAVQAETLPMLPVSAVVRVDTEMTPATLPIPTENVPADSTRIITGHVIDQADKMSLYGASIFVKGVSTGVITDTTGYFQVSVPSDTKEETLMLRVAMIGYITTEVQLPATQHNPLLISLRQDDASLGEVIVVGNYRKLSFWQRLRNRFRTTH